jgi:hypothetical protein
MLTKQDVQIIREIMREEINSEVPKIIDAKVPGMIKRGIEATVPDMIQNGIMNTVPGMITNGVAPHFSDLITIISDMNDGINAKFDRIIMIHESRLTRLEKHTGIRN